MGEVAFRRKSTFLMKCDKCRRPTHYTYRMTLGDMQYTFCSGLCAEAARKEFVAKEKQSITPSNSEPLSDLIEEGDLNG